MPITRQPKRRYLRQLKIFGQLFTWPTDQPRHATCASDCPVEPSCWPPHFAVRAGHGLLHARHLTFPAVRGLLRIQYLPPCIDRRFDSTLNTSRLAPSADCSTFSSLRSCCAWIAPCSTLRAFAPCADCSALDPQRSALALDCSSVGSSRSAPLADCSAFSA